jgi:hypothetical protein
LCEEPAADNCVWQRLVVSCNLCRAFIFSALVRLIPAHKTIHNPGHTPTRHQQVVALLHPVALVVLDTERVAAE